jgi:lysozyme
MTPGRKMVGAFVLSVAALAGIKLHEGSVHQVYLDPVGIPTVCVGHTATVTKKDVGRVVSPALCDVLLREDLRYAEAAVKRLVKVPVTQGQYDALVSFTFNVGEGNLATSSLLKFVNGGQCYRAASEFPKWVYAKGKRLPGLVKRRADERKVFEAGCDLSKTALMVPYGQPAVLRWGVTYT